MLSNYWLLINQEPQSEKREEKHNQRTEMPEVFVQSKLPWLESVVILGC